MLSLDQVLINQTIGSWFFVVSSLSLAPSRPGSPTPKAPPAPLFLTYGSFNC